MESRHLLTRRQMLQTSGFGFGSLALTYLLNEQASAAAHAPAIAHNLKARAGHFPAQARAMVHFMQNGGPSQMDLFERKPELQKRGGQPIPRSVETYQKGNTEKILASPFQFHRRGRCGMELSEVLPHL